MDDYGDKRPGWKWFGPQVGTLLQGASLVLASVAFVVTLTVQPEDSGPEVRSIVMGSCSSSEPGRLELGRAR